MNPKNSTEKSPRLLQNGWRRGDVWGHCFPNSDWNNISFSQLSSTLTPSALILPPCPYHRPLKLQRMAYWALPTYFWMCHYILQLTTSVSRVSRTVTVYKADSAFLMSNRRQHSPEYRHQDHSENRHTRNCALYLSMHWCKHFSLGLRWFVL